MNSVNLGHCNYNAFISGFLFNTPRGVNEFMYCHIARELWNSKTELGDSKTGDGTTVLNLQADPIIRFVLCQK